MKTALEAEPGQIPHDWVVGLALLPYGLVLSSVMIAMPFLLSAHGIAVDRIASVSAAALSPLFWGACLVPTVDTWCSRRTYAVLYVVMAGVATGAALAALASDQVLVMTLLLMVAVLAAVLYVGAVAGWVAQFLPETRRGPVGGWSNAAIVAGGSVGAMALVLLSERVSLQTVGAIAASGVALGAWPLITFPRSERPELRIGQVVSGAVESVLRASTSGGVRLGFLLFLSPAGASAAINLFSGLGRDFAASDSRVIWVTGIGAACASAIGALAGGALGRHFDRRTIYLGAGGLTGACAIAMAFAPHNPLVFTVGVLVYSALFGVMLAAFTALGLELVGTHNPSASTMLGLFLASLNGASAYMTWLDGVGYQWGGITGLLLVDGGSSVTAALGLLAFVRRTHTPSHALQSTSPVESGLRES
jgi:MFS transporter, PAT family, beta-lactamase induction signal transducer AmpG